MPDAVWQIELVALLRAAAYLRPRQAELLREECGQFQVVCSGTEAADR